MSNRCMTVAFNSTLLMPLATLTAYSVFAGSNAGLNSPSSNSNPLKSALLASARVTVTIYVFSVPSWAVTTISISFGPTITGIEKAVPLTASSLLIFPVAVLSATVAFKLTLLTLLPIFTAYSLFAGSNNGFCPRRIAIRPARISLRTFVFLRLLGRSWTTLLCDCRCHASIRPAFKSLF